MSDEPQLLMAGQMVEYDSRNHKGRHRHLKSGSIWLAEQEVERATWDLLETVPANAIIHHVIWWSDGDPTGREKAEPSPLDEVPEAYPDDGGPAQPLPLPAGIVKPTGRWGAYWEKMFHRQFYTFPALLELLNIKNQTNLSGQVRSKLHQRFNGTPSLTMISPCQMEGFLLTHHMPKELVEKSRRIVEELGGNAYRWPKKDKTEAA